MRFICDHDVDAAVAHRLRQLGHDAWTAAAAGLATASDDELTAYADDKRAALITHDRAFSQRRKRNVVGQHIWLCCAEFDGADLIESRIAKITKLLEISKDIWIRVSPEGTETLSFAWE